MDKQNKIIIKIRDLLDEYLDLIDVSDEEKVDEEEKEPTTEEQEDVDDDELSDEEVKRILKEGK